jgi:hypothetical protein
MVLYTPFIVTEEGVEPSRTFVHTFLNNQMDFFVVYFSHIIIVSTNALVIFLVIIIIIFSLMWFQYTN